MKNQRSKYDGNWKLLSVLFFYIYIYFYQLDNIIFLYKKNARLSVHRKQKSKPKKWAIIYFQLLAAALSPGDPSNLTASYRGLYIHLFG